MKPVLSALMLVFMASLLSPAAESADGVLVLNEKRVRLGTAGPTEAGSGCQTPQKEEYTGCEPAPGPI